MLKYWLWLSSRKGLGCCGQLAVLRHFGTPEAAYCAAPEEYARVPGLNNTSGLKDKDLKKAERIVAECYRKQISILTYQDAAYPERLRAIDDAPLVLYYKGTIPALDTMPVIAMVGTRKASAYGLMQAKQFGYQLGRMGAAVVSGGADGVDTMALKGALTAGAPVIAVLGCGVDVAYPAINRSLFADIAANGWLVSEYPPGTPANSFHFPVRNRLLSALSVGVLVVEAPVRSGSLITARRALDQGRDVFALSANVDSVNCAGNLQLLRQGAIVATEAWDILREYTHLYPELPVRQPKLRAMTLGREELRQSGDPDTRIVASERSIPKNSDKKDVDKSENKAYIDVNEILQSLSADEKAVVLAVQDGPIHIDDVVDRCQLPAGRVLASVTLLEVKGYIKRLPAGRFCLAEK